MMYFSTVRQLNYFCVLVGAITLHSYSAATPLVAAQFEGCNLTFIPHNIDELFMYKDTVVNFNLTCSDICAQCANDRGILRVTSQNDAVAAADATFVIPNLAPTSQFSGNFSVKGIFIGRTKLKFTITNPQKTLGRQSPEAIVYDEYAVVVIREQRTVDSVFNIVIIILQVMNTIGFGCKLDLQVVKEIFKKPIAPVIGFLCQFTIMPTVSFALGKIFSLSNELAFGLLAIGCSPGGGQSNVWTILLDGDINLSLTMTFISNFAALGMMPLWLLTLGRLLVSKEIKIPFVNILTSLATLIIPCLIGLLIRRVKSSVADFIAKLIKPFSLLLVLFVITFGTWVNSYMFTLLREWKNLVCGMLLPWTGLVLGGLVAFISRRPWYRVKTIAIETAMQNVGIPIILLRFSLGPPEGDITSVMPVSASIFTGAPFWICLLCLVIYKKCCKAKDAADGDRRESKLPLEMENPAMSKSDIAFDDITTVDKNGK